MTEEKHPEHAVHRLRRQLRDKSTRPFLARGSFMQRCEGCLLAPKACLCDWQPRLATSVGICLIMHPLEPLKPTNTGRLIADCLPATHAFVWSRTETAPQLEQLLADPQWQPYIVFPGEYAQPNQQVLQELPERSASGKRPLLIILDATWTQARKMFRKSPCLAGLPILSLRTEQLSRYRLRRSCREEHLCTVEVAAACLALAGDETDAQLLGDYFDLFTEAYLASRANRPVDLDTPAHQRLALHLSMHVNAQ
ncbi:tRNA-uridine aminocarboxypropyltransferase [uncultured Halopseudomonas sp.]|uniref:tRNA-uridine aminocarboxypropyltransferase n=1 Tax=uncultured Halopseudomonas sp. TaxID=2901193 RepID=UPI0030EDB041|tara:strand:- start:11229 stop:11987 length:759 start_codon:yes stop_codon:yes gene_type:complete